MEPFKIVGHDLSEVMPQEKIVETSQAPLEIKHTHFEKLRLHPYVSALLATAALIVVGILIVSTRSAVSSGGGVHAWGGANINFLNPANGAPQKTTQTDQNTISQQGGYSAPYSYIPPAPRGSDAEADSFDFSAFLSTLSQGSAASSSAQGSADVQFAYSFIPQGLISTSSPTKKRTKDQQQLYDYGNEAGSYIQSLEEAHRDQGQVLKNWLEDRSDSAKAAAVVQLARALWETGQSLSRMESIPTSVQATHTALAKGYMDIGANLGLVAKTQNDEDLLKSIGVYNASADTFTTTYVALATLFTAHAVTFSADDPGTVFTFTPVSL